MFTENVAKVVSLHREGGINCAQAMLSIYGKYFGLQEDDALKVSAALGGGMGGMGKICGSVTGAFLVFGLTYEIGNPESRGKVYELVKEFTERFTAKHGSISCSELLGHDIGTEEGRRAVREQQLTKKICPALDQTAAELVEELLAGRLEKRQCDEKG